MVLGLFYDLHFAFDGLDLPGDRQPKPGQIAVLIKQGHQARGEKRRLT